MATRNSPKPRPGTPIENRNFLAPVGFKFTLKRAPAVAFFCNEANIPDMTLGVAEQPSYLKNIPIPGDKIQFGDLNLRFLVDEDLTNYMEIQNWIRGLGFPEDLEEFDDLEKKGTLAGAFGQFKQTGDDIYSDATLQILSSNLIPKFNIKFRDIWPYSLTTMTFDATDTDIDYFTADASFKYTIYDITDLEDNIL